MPTALVHEALMVHPRITELLRALRPTHTVMMVAGACAEATLVAFDQHCADGLVACGVVCADAWPADIVIATDADVVRSLSSPLHPVLPEHPHPLLARDPDPVAVVER